MNRYNDDFYGEQGKGMSGDDPQFRHGFKPQLQPDKPLRKAPRIDHPNDADMISIKDVLAVIHNTANGQPFARVDALLLALREK